MQQLADVSCEFSPGSLPLRFVAVELKMKNGARVSLDKDFTAIAERLFKICTQHPFKSFNLPSEELMKAYTEIYTYFSSSNASSGRRHNYEVDFYSMVFSIFNAALEASITPPTHTLQTLQELSSQIILRSLRVASRPMLCWASGKSSCVDMVRGPEAVQRKLEKNLPKHIIPVIMSPRLLPQPFVDSPFSKIIRGAQEGEPASAEEFLTACRTLRFTVKLIDNYWKYFSRHYLKYIKENDVVPMEFGESFSEFTSVWFQKRIIPIPELRHLIGGRRNFEEFV